MLDVILYSQKPVSLKRKNIKVTPKDPVFLIITAKTTPIEGFLSLRDPFRSIFFSQKVHVPSNKELSFKLKMEKNWPSGLYVVSFQDYNSQKSQEIGFFVQNVQEPNPQWKLSY
ncbi:MAG: hypothetical protein ACFFBD_20870, partial [Candidatus Hodarchaeota archaeon]